MTVLVLHAPLNEDNAAQPAPTVDQRTWEDESSGQNASKVTSSRIYTIPSTLSIDCSGAGAERIAGAQSTSVAGTPNPSQINPSPTPRNSESTPPHVHFNLPSQPVQQRAVALKEPAYQLHWQTTQVNQDPPFKPGSSYLRPVLLLVLFILYLFVSMPLDDVRIYPQKTISSPSKSPAPFLNLQATKSPPFEP